MFKKPAHPEDAKEFANHLTWKTRWGIRHFTDIDLGLACLEAIEHERRRMKVDIFAYALMPNHLHLIIAPQPRRVGLVVQAFKLATVHRLMADGLAEGGLWQRGYWDVAMRDLRQLYTAMEYIHNNPVKEGLVAEPWDYPLSSSGYWEHRSEGPIRLEQYQHLSFV
jgi:REP element-mobilizing transposase RayT